jgi:hypothetical protein
MLATLFMPAAAQSTCRPGFAAGAAAVVQQRQAELLSVKVQDMDTNVAAPLQAKIRGMKDALANAINAGMACAQPGEDAMAIQARLAKLLNANLPGKPFQPSTRPVADSKEPVFDDQVYGTDLKLAVSTPSNLTSMRVVQASFGIECGDDAMMLFYEPSEEARRPVLRWQSPDYKEISGAFGDMFLYAVVPGVATNSVRAVVVHGTPWCTSRFSGFGIDVLAAQQGLETPRIVWHSARGYSRGDFESRLRAIPNGFELRLNVPALDSEAYERTVIYRYQFENDTVTRVGPIATNGRGFVEEWLSMPWNEAAGQTESESIAGMKPVHDRVEHASKDSKTYVSYTYGTVRSCQPKGMYEVEMLADPGGPQFFTIRENASGYAMVNFSTVQDERCSGRDLMKKP